MISRAIYFLLFFLSISPYTFAATAKQIALKDGSLIKGELISFENGLYTVQTENLGRLQLPEANVVSIANEGVVTQAPQMGQQTAAAPGFSNKVSAMQTKIMGDPQAMQAVQAMAEDPEIAAMLADPNFIKQLTSAVSSDNMDSVAGDPKIQQLMGNPKMQSLIQQLQGKSADQQ